MAEMVTTYWRLAERGTPVQYGQVTAPRGDKQPLPRGARVLTREMYEAELAEQARAHQDTVDAIEAQALQAQRRRREQRAAAARELAALGLSPTAAAAFTGALIPTDVDAGLADPPAGPAQGGHRA